MKAGDLNKLRNHLHQDAIDLMEDTVRDNQPGKCGSCQKELGHILDMTSYYPDDTLIMLDRWSARLRKRRGHNECNTCPATDFRAWHLPEKNTAAQG